MKEQPRLDWMVSCDDHILEPPTLWQDRIPAKYRDIAPRISHEKTADFWLYEDRKAPMLGLLTAMGRPREHWTPDPTTYASMRPGCYDVKERLKRWDEAKAAWQAYSDYVAKHTGAGFAPSSASRIQAIDDMLKQEKAYVAVRERIAAEKAAPPPSTTPPKK